MTPPPLYRRTASLPHRYSHSFTLIELLIVVAIIGVLASLLLPALKSARDAGIRAQCVNTLKQHGITVMLYCDDNGEHFPNNTVNKNPQWRYLWNLNTNAYSHYFPSSSASDLSNPRYNNVEPKYICPAYRRRLDAGQFDAGLANADIGFGNGIWNAAHIGYQQPFYMSNATKTGRFLGGMTPADVGSSTSDGSGAVYPSATTPPARCAMIWDAGFFSQFIGAVSVGHPNGWSVLFVDQHVKYFNLPNDNLGNNYGCGLKTSLPE